MIGDEVLVVARRFVPTASKVVDAERPIYIEVNGRHVRHSKKDAAHCPLANAACEGMELQGALVSRGVIYAIKDDVVTRYVPASASRGALNAFDETGNFPPGIYRFDPPAPNQRLENIRHHWEKRKGKKNAMRRKAGRRPNGNEKPNGSPPQRVFAKPGLRPPLLAAQP